MDYKHALGISSIAIGVAAYAIYLWQTAKKEGVQPHPFSWLLWGLVTGVAFLVQRGEQGGPGIWVTGFTAAVCFIIGAVTLAKHRWRFSRFDWFSLVSGLVVVGFYVASSDPTRSAVLATAADALGYSSTIKKGWSEPYKDSATSFALNSIKFVPALFGLESYSIATWLYPLTLVALNAGVVFLLLIRRWQIRQPAAKPVHS